MINQKLLFSTVLCSNIILLIVGHLEACRVGSELLKLYTRKSIERIIDANNLESFYWNDEPLNVETLSKITGLNISLAETQFSLELNEKDFSNFANDSQVTSNEVVGRRGKLIQDLFVTCSADRDRSYRLTINLELDNPFKMIDFRFNSQEVHQQQQQSNSSLKSSLETNAQTNGIFRIYLPDSTFLVQLNQRISYDECLDVNYVQLGPNVNYQVDCLNCSENQRIHLDRVFSKKMTQFDAELDSMLSEKLLLGLQILLNQQRLDLDLFVV